MRKVVLILAAILCLTGCYNSEIYVPEFLTESTLRMEIAHKSVFTADSLHCQYSCNPQRGEFRVFTDNMSDYYHLVLEEIPTGENCYVKATQLDWTETNGANQTRKNITLEVVKLQGDVIWPWYPSEGIKLTVNTTGLYQ